MNPTVADFLAGFGADSVRLAIIVFLTLCLVSLEAERSRLKRARWDPRKQRPDERIRAKTTEGENI